MVSSKLDTVALHRDLSSAIAASLFLVFLFTEPSAFGDNEVLVGSLAIIATRSTLCDEAVVLQRIVSESDILSTDPLEWCVSFAFDDRFWWFRYRNCTADVVSLALFGWWCRGF